MKTKLKAAISYVRLHPKRTLKLGMLTLGALIIALLIGNRVYHSIGTSVTSWWEHKKDGRPYWELILKSYKGNTYRMVDKYTNTVCFAVAKFNERKEPQCRRMDSDVVTTAPQAPITR